MRSSLPVSVRGKRRSSMISEGHAVAGSSRRMCNESNATAVALSRLLGASPASSTEGTPAEDASASRASIVGASPEGASADGAPAEGASVEGMSAEGTSRLGSAQRADRGCTMAMRRPLMRSAAACNASG